MRNKILFVFLAFLGFQVMAQSVRTYIPVNAYKYVPMLKEEQVKHWPDHIKPEMLASLIEHESCISLKHSK